jgi:hypothetical protein
VNSTNILEGWYPPFTARDAYVERSILSVVATLNIKAIFVYTTACKVGSCAEILFADRSWCHLLGELQVLVLETGLLDGADTNRLCETTTPEEVITVMMTAGDYNPWMAIKRGWYIVLFRIVCTLLAAAAACLALAKLIAYARTEGIKANVPQLILLTQFLSSQLRCLIFALDPIYSGLLFNSVAAHMTITVRFSLPRGIIHHGQANPRYSQIHIPFNFISLLLLAMYWSEILNESKIYFTSFLSRLRIPFILASIFIVLVEIATSVIRAAPALWRAGLKANTATAVSAIVYMIFAITISAFFFVYGIKVIRRIKESSRSANVHGAGQTASLQRITGLLVGCAVFNAIFVIGFVMAAIDAFFWQPIGQTAGLTIIAIGILGSSLTQVAAVKFPDMESDSKKAGTVPTARGSVNANTGSTAGSQSISKSSN